MLRLPSRFTRPDVLFHVRPRGRSADAREAGQARLLVQQLLEARDVHALLAQHVDQDAGVDGAAAGTHDEAVERGKSHGAGVAAAVRQRAEAGAVAEMGDYRAAGRCGTVIIRESAGDELVGEAVEAVAAQSLLGEGQRSERKSTRLNSSH